MNPSVNPISMLLDIFRSPVSCFLALSQRGLWGWQAYLVLIISPFVFWSAYFDLVPFVWLKENLTTQLAQNAPQQLELLNANTLMAIEIISDVAGRTLTIFMLSVWFYFATKSSSVPQGFWRWFAASCVIVFPAVIGDIASYTSVLMQHGYVMIFAADLNSLNGLLKLPLTNEWSHFASAVPLLLPWYIALGYTAVSTWTGFARGESLVISALPWLACYLIWALYILLS
ncbi:YIP1 family protein [Vibrio ostreicida]|uniref:YIP1 family protein n=1 Tax=Vibrio ostreicida TaxID=526588 RepID=UPI003B5C1256